MGAAHRDGDAGELVWLSPKGGSAGSYQRQDHAYKRFELPSSGTVWQETGIVRLLLRSRYKETVVTFVEYVWLGQLSLVLGDNRRLIQVRVVIACSDSW